MHRFFVPAELIEGGEVFFPTDLAYQLTRVLRLRQGDRVLVLDNSGLAREVELHTIAKRSAQGTVRATHQGDTELRTHLTLYAALLKGKKLDLVLQKGTELGIVRFVPVLTQRSVLGSLDDLGNAKLDRWEAIIREAAEQSGRYFLPELSEPQLFDVSLGEARARGGLSLIPWEGEQTHSLKEALNPPDAPRPTRVNLFIGPEGGFEEDEVLNAQAYGAHPITLGPRILRAETAAIAAATAVLYELGDWEPR